MKNALIIMFLVFDEENCSQVVKAVKIVAKILYVSGIILKVIIMGIGNQIKNFTTYVFIVNNLFDIFISLIMEILIIYSH